MHKREIKAVADLLNNPENDSKTAEEVAELAIQALDDCRGRTHRIAVVGQIQYGPQEPTYTVALGPFSSRGHLDSPEKFRQATQGGTAARDAGRYLAWDTKTGTGKGRFMLVPVFRSARDAWDFHRPPKGHAGEAMNLLLPPPPHISEALGRWQPGLWAEEHHRREAS